jgi:DNA-directed RNA polymerase sigma subunit (sigma70/sigma32)
MCGRKDFDFMGKGDDPNNCKKKLSPVQRQAAAMAVDVDALTPEEAKAFALTEVFKRIEYKATAVSRRAVQREVLDGRLAFERAVDGHAVLDKDDEYNVVRVAKNHPNPQMRKRAESLLFMCNQRFVKERVAAKVAVWGDHGFESDELTNVAAEGIRAAIDKFDTEFVVKPGRPKPKFLTYARPWINQKLGRYIENNSERIYGTRIPTTPFWEIQNINQAINSIDNGRDLTPEELVEHPALGFVGRVKKKKKAMSDEELEMNEADLRDPRLSKQTLTTEQRVERIRHAIDMQKRKGVQSLQDQVRGGNSGAYHEGSERGDFILRDEGPSIESEVESSVLRKQIMQIAEERLTPRELEVMKALDLFELTEDGEVTPARSINQLADQTSTKVVALRLIAREAKEKLREGLADAGLAPSDHDDASDFEEMMTSV